jgi:integrase
MAQQPLEHSLAKPKAAKNHAALDYKNVGAFVAELRKDPGIAARALEFTILTASRTGEVRGATWGEINLEERLWTIPAARMKMRDKQGRGDHIVPLNDAAMAILEAVRGGGIPHPKKHVFVGRFGADLGESTLRRVLERVCEAMKIEAPSVHGFRSTFSDWVSDCTHFDEETREFCLAHVKTGVAGAYRRKTAIEKRAVLMAMWADFCYGIATDNVIPLKRTA